MRYASFFIVVILIVVILTGLLILSGCDNSSFEPSADLFEGTWVNENPDLEDDNRICRIDVVTYAGGYRVKRWNPGDHIQQVWIEFPSSEMLTVEWDYFSISTETLTLNLLSPDRLEAVRVLDFVDEQFTDRTDVEFFVREEREL